MPTQGASGRPLTRPYNDDEEAHAVRLVHQLRAELGTEHGTTKRVPPSSTTRSSRCAAGYSMPKSIAADFKIALARRNSRFSSVTSIGPHRLVLT